MIFSADRVPIYNKKIQFKSYLDHELDDRKYKVIVSYEWARTDQIVSFRVMDDHVLRIWVNLNFYKDWPFSSNEKAQELSLRYRVYYISAYIRCLEEVITGIPASYFSGLVSLCMINTICGGKKETSCSPVSEKRLSKLRPVDIHCAADALIKMVKEYQSILSEEEMDQCSSVINNLLAYSILPEIGYVNRRPVYALLCELKEYRLNMSKGRIPQEKFPLFGGYEGSWPDQPLGSDQPLGYLITDQPLGHLIGRAVHDRNPFWTGAALRLILADGSEAGSEQADILRDCVNEYRENSVRYYKEFIKADSVLLADNYTAVQKLSSRMNKVFTDVAAETGVLHYYQ